MRKYRITMNASEGKWYIEVSGWLSLLGILTPIYKTFNSFYEAQEWAYTQGLHEAYVYAPLNREQSTWTTQTSQPSAKQHLPRFNAATTVPQPAS